MTLHSERKSFTIKLSATGRYTSPVTLVTVITIACRHVAAWVKMARMASRPRIGALIRDGMERARMDQIQLAAAVGASRSAVNSWINDRSWPEGWRIVALEEALGITLPRWADEGAQDSGQKEERLRAALEQLREDSLIEADDVTYLMERYERRRRNRGSGMPGAAERAG